MTNYNSDLKTLAWFSCGATSYVACKIAKETMQNVQVVYIDVGWEHEDNARFLRDAEKMLGQIMILKHPKYVDPMHLFSTLGYIKSPYGAPCTTQLKKGVRQRYETGLEMQVFGFDASETSRRDRFLDANKEQAHLFVFPLIDHGITKQDCLQIIENDEIVIPAMYRLGFKNANCIGCVKGGKGYWKKIKQHFPQRFEEMSKLERQLNFSLFRTTPKHGRQPLFLDEIIWENVKEESGLSWDCGILCKSEDEND